MKLLVASVLAGVLWAVVAYGADPKIDGSSKEAFDRSVKAMTDSLSEGDRKIFGEGLMNFIVTDYPPARGMTGLAILSVAPRAMDAAHVTTNGKTLSEIMERGRAIIARKGEGQLKGPDGGADAKERRACLERKVVIASAAIERDRFGADIVVNVTNNLDWAIGGVWISYTAESIGRPVPWIEKDFAMGVAGGIQPGETRRMSTSAFPPSDAPDALVVKAKILDVADQDKRLFVMNRKVMGWSDTRSERVCN